MTRLSRRTLLAGSVAGLVLPGMAALAQTPRSRAPMLNVGFADFPATWDPLGSRDFATLWLATLLYDTILQVDPDGALVPGLGLYTGWNRDRSELTITPRPNVTMPDGAPFTVNHILQGLQRARERSWRLEHVAEVVAAEDGTVRLRMARLDSALEASLAHPELSILPNGGEAFPAAVAAGTFPRGTGPFFALRIDNDEEVRLLPNPRYWQIGRPRLTAVRISVIPQDTTRTASLLTGSVDLVPDVPLLDAALIRASPDLRLVGAESTIGCILVPNLRVAPTSSVRFRTLLQRAIDRGALVAAATGNEATAQHVPVPQAHWAHLDTPLEQADRDEVRQQFRNLGYPLGLRLRLIADERNVAFSNAAVFLQEQLAFIGIALTVDLLDPVDVRAALESGDYDLLATNLDAWQDPHELFRPLVRSDGVRNVNGYASGQCDRLIDAATLIDTLERRGVLYRQVQEVLLREVPFVVLYLQRYFDGMTSLLESYPQYPPVRGLAMRHCHLDPAATS